MIRVVPSAGLSPLARFALDVLVDQARLLPVLDPGADVVILRDCDAALEARSLGEFAASGWPFQVGEGRVGIPRLLLAEIGAAAGATREQLTDEADRFQRVPSRVNAMYAAGAVREPLVSRCAVALRTAVIAAAARRPLAFLQPWPGGHRWAAALSHDLDVVDWWGAFTALRLVELARKGQWRVFARVVRSALGSLGPNPVVRAAQHLLAVERQAGVRSTWFVLCGEPTLGSARRGDITYSVRTTRSRAILAAIRNSGHEIGLHGSFDTMLSPSSFRRQREELESIAETPVRGVRQHYLRMRPGATHRAMEQAGFTYDATFGFPDHSGFRLGLADVVARWDEKRGRSDEFDLVPLVWMDRTLSKYHGVEDPARWVEDAIELAGVSASVEGLWVGLWHPNSASALGYPGAEEAYAALLSRITAMQPYLASIVEIVSWRRLRRSCRALSVDAAGRPLWAAQGPDTARAALEDAHAQPTAWG